MVLAFTSIGPTHAHLNQIQRLDIAGTGLGSVIRAWIDSTPPVELSVFSQSATELRTFAGFYSSVLAAGTYDVKVDDGTDVATLAAGFEILSEATLTGEGVDDGTLSGLGLFKAGESSIGADSAVGDSVEGTITAVFTIPANAAPGPWVVQYLVDGSQSVATLLGTIEITTSFTFTAAEVAKTKATASQNLECNSIPWQTVVALCDYYLSRRGAVDEADAYPYRFAAPGEPKLIRPTDLGR